VVWIVERIVCKLPIVQADLFYTARLCNEWWQIKHLIVFFRSKKTQFELQMVFAMFDNIFNMTKPDFKKMYKRGVGHELLR
jgi:hypothetical protein